MNQFFASLNEALDHAADCGFFHQAEEFDFSGNTTGIRLSVNPEDRNDPRLAWVRQEGAVWRLAFTSASERMLRGAA